MNPEMISTELTELYAAEYEDFLRRERPWEARAREQSMARYEQDRDNLFVGLRNGALISGAIVGAVIWIILHL